eukprot:9120703-Pyramimonas_sp.AAC.1
MQSRVRAGAADRPGGAQLRLRWLGATCGCWWPRKSPESPMLSAARKLAMAAAAQPRWRHCCFSR